MSDPIKNELRRAYDLIKQGDKPAALAILRPLCRDYPDRAEAWWLAANAMNDPQQVKAALQKVLVLDPFHEAAQRRLDQLNAGARVTQTMQLTSTQEIKKAPAQKRIPGWITFLLLAVLMGGGAVAMVMATQSGADEPAAAAPTIEIPTLVALPPTAIPVPTDTFTPAPPTNTPTATVTRTPLPATWTPIATWTTDPNVVTATSWIQPTRTLATANPALFGDTYWEGNGDGWTLDTLRRSDGRYARFFEFPVQVYVSGADAVWDEAVNHALSQIGQVVPVERTYVQNEADLEVMIFPREEFNKKTVCSGDDNTELIGCATLLDLGGIVSDRFARMYGEAFIAADASNPKWAALHEMLHAFGVYVHSDNPADVMYYQESETQIYLSQRDINTLTRLYANPSYGD